MLQLSGKQNGQAKHNSFVHLLFVFWSFNLSVASLLFMKGISYCVIRGKLEPLDRAKANFKRS